MIAPSGAPADHPETPYSAMVTVEGLAAVAEYADMVGVETTLIVPRDADNAALAPTTLVADAHAAGLQVAVWTFRAENYFLPQGDRRGDPAATDYLRLPGDLTAQLKIFYALGVDAVFSDFPAIAVSARR